METLCDNMKTLCDNMKTEIAECKEARDQALADLRQSLADFQLLVQERKHMQVLITANNAIIQHQKQTIAELQHYKDKYERIMHGE